jgi:hypothetical protein
MENVIEFLKKHKTKLLILLVVIFFFKSCGGSKDIKDLERKHMIEIDEIKKNNELDKNKSYKEGQVNAFNIVIDDVSKIDRPPVLMNLHNKWINDRDQVNKTIK